VKTPDNIGTITNLANKRLSRRVQMIQQASHLPVEGICQWTYPSTTILKKSRSSSLRQAEAVCKGLQGVRSSNAVNLNCSS
jgi:hypothetical protein